MKGLFLLPALIILLLLSLFNSACRRNRADGPKPVDPVNMMVDEAEKHRLKQEWIEQMHLTAPGVDWREIDQLAREEMYRNRLPALQSLDQSGRRKAGTLESFGDGMLTGTWKEKGSSNLSGRVHCVDVDFADSRLYAASAGGQVWMAELDGTGWRSLSDPYRIDNIQFIRGLKNNQGGTRILASNHRVRMNYTDDYGTTWLHSEGLSSYYNDYEMLRAVSMQNGTIYLLSYRSGYLSIHCSSDLGSTFRRLIRVAGSSYSDIWTDRFGNDTLYLIDRDKVYKMVDSVNLQKIADVPLNFGVGEIQQIQLSGTRLNLVTYLYAMYRIEGKSRFFGVDDNGKTWRYRGETNAGPFMSNSFGVSTANPRLLGFGGVEAHRSENGGPTWIAVNGWGEYYGDMLNKLHADIPEIEFFKMPDNREIAYISTDGGTFLSSDQMKTVRNVSLKDLNISQYYSTYTHRTQNHIIYAGAQDQGFQRTLEANEGEVAFEQTISGDYGHLVSGDGGISIWTVYPGFAMYYPDLANSTAMSTWDFKGNNHYWMPPLMEDPYFPNRCWIACGTTSSGSHLWLLEYRSTAIVHTELPYDFSGTNGNAWISAMAYSHINRDYMYVLNSEGKFFYSTDHGTTWTQSTSTGPGSHYFYGNSIVPSPRDINTIYLAGSGYSGSSVWVSHDGGETFQKLNNGLKNTLIFEMVSNEDGSLLFAASEIAPWVYIKALDKWFDLSGSGAPQQTWWSVDYVPSLKTARFGTYGRGIWDFRIETFNGIGDVPVGQPENALRIYPNPFIDRISVATDGLMAGTVTVRMMASDGKLIRVKRLSEGLLPGCPVILSIPGIPAGRYYLTLTGTDGKTVSAAVIKQ